ncbi:uncharacterized protein LOC105172592 isoform X1 [Sesamum indicum]|uniref:Uncharacterized protein LOC105172592 isoform X1 n=1 Tax=Sesamum indicum TaxID=4182 RepID=A0A6I9U0X2_SESIN|nr:uncharacterized protein LOC105172592 isoform X1 [Sesamum indicum]
MAFPLPSLSAPLRRLPHNHRTREPSSRRRPPHIPEHRWGEMVTNTEEDPKQKLQPQLVKLDKGFKLAEQWVNNMSKSSYDEKSTLLELEGRPSRLGIGATVPKQSKVTHSDNPVERKLLAKLHADKRKVVKRDEDFVPSAKDGNVDDDSEEEETESKTRAFSKKRHLSLTSPLNAKKKHK